MVFDSPVQVASSNAKKQTVESIPYVFSWMANLRQDSSTHYCGAGRDLHELDLDGDPDTLLVEQKHIRKTSEPGPSLAFEAHRDVSSIASRSNACVLFIRFLRSFGVVSHENNLLLVLLCCIVIRQIEEWVSNSVPWRAAVGHVRGHQRVLCGQTSLCERLALGSLGHRWQPSAACRTAVRGPL